jgi:hypothetical protein
MLSAVKGMDLGADLRADAAVDAFPLREGKVFLFFNAFGIVAPQAAKRTAFQENRGTNTGTVMDAEKLNIEYAACLALYVFIRYVFSDFHSGYAAFFLTPNVPSGR